MQSSDARRCAHRARILHRETPQRTLRRGRLDPGRGRSIFGDARDANLEHESTLINFNKKPRRLAVISFD
jgi:hypothetical protein